VHAAIVDPSQLWPHVGSPPGVAQPRLPRGAPWIVMQEPTLPGSSHAWQVLVQATLQQTPSAQKPVAHSSFVAHVAPLAIEVPRVSTPEIAPTDCAAETPPPT
jgi:hypothetical protein